MSFLRKVFWCQKKKDRGQISAGFFLVSKRKKDRGKTGMDIGAGAGERNDMYILTSSPPRGASPG